MHVYVYSIPNIMFPQRFPRSTVTSTPIKPIPTRLATEMESFSGFATTFFQCRTRSVPSPLPYPKPSSFLWRADGCSQRDGHDSDISPQYSRYPRIPAAQGGVHNRKRKLSAIFAMKPYPPTPALAMARAVPVTTFGVNFGFSMLSVCIYFLQPYNFAETSPLLLVLARTPF